MTSRLVRILALTWTAGLIGVVQALRAPQLHRLASTSDAMAFALLMMLAIVSEMKPMPYSFGRESKANSLTITVVLCTLFVFGWPVAVLVAAASVIVADIVSNKPYYKVLFNASVYVVATIAAAGAYEVAAGYLTGVPGLPSALALLASGFAAGFSYYAVNVMLLMMVISEVQGGRLVRMIAWDMRDSP